MNTPTADATNMLPPPREVRERLANALREADLLRRLLRVCERAEQYRQADGAAHQEPATC